jgi:hypothetical protein
MYYGIMFFIDENGTLYRVCLLSSDKPIKENVYENVKKEGNTMYVSRAVMLPTENELSYQEAEQKAIEWYKKFREDKIIEVLKGE